VTEAEKEKDETPPEFKSKHAPKGDLDQFTLLEFYERSALQVLEKKEKAGLESEGFGKSHLFAIIAVMATPYDKDRLFGLPKGKSNMEFFLEAMEKHPHLTVDLQKKLLKHKKIFDPAKLRKNNNAGIDLIRFNLLTGKAKSMTDIDLCLHVNDAMRELELADVTIDAVRGARRILAKDYKDWIRLRKKFAGKFCAPPPSES
jgi:hypothetical protein